MEKNMIFKKRKGAALAWTLIAFTVLMIFMSTIFFITTQDIRETRMQEERLRTYYIASAGVDLIYAALMDPNNEPKYLVKAIEELENNGNTPITESISIENNSVVMGTANITIKRVTVDEKNWLQITSVGKLRDKNTEVPTTMRINEENSNQIVREKFGY